MAEYVQVYVHSDGPFCDTVARMVKEECRSNSGSSF